MFSFICLTHSNYIFARPMQASSNVLHNSFTTQINTGPKVTGHFFPPFPT